MLVGLVMLPGCFPGPALRYEQARPETVTLLAGSVTAGAIYNESVEKTSESLDDDVYWEAVAPNLTFTAWGRWALSDRWELSTGADLDFGGKNALSVAGAAKLLMTPTDRQQRVHLAASLALGLSYIAPAGAAAWVDLGLPLTIDATADTSVTLRPHARYAVYLVDGDEFSQALFAGGSLAVRHPCGETAVCVYELALIGLALPADTASSREGLVEGSFGVGVVF